MITGWTDAEAPIFWTHDVKSWLIGKDPVLGKMKARGDGGNRGWDVWMASVTQWVWANSRRLWWAEKPGMPQSIGSQRVSHDLMVEQQPQF